jgi:D-amino peptidase
MFMTDLCAAIEGLLEGGADQVTIYDEHYYGRNVDLSALPVGVSVICGKPPYRPDWAGGLDDSFQGVILLGFHSKSGTSDGLLAHSYEPDIRDLRLNGVSVGEIGIEAAVAGDWDVPVLLITGDSAAIGEAEVLLPGVRGVVVKESLGATGGCCYPTAMTTSAIRDAARQVITSPPPVRAYRLSSEVTLEIELNDGPYLDAVRQELPARMRADRVMVFRGVSATTVWADYWEAKLHCQGIAAKKERGE